MNSQFHITVFVRLCFFCCFVAITASAFTASNLSAADLLPFLKAERFDCHAGETTEAGLNLSTLKHDLEHPELFAKWERIFDRVASREMPPRLTAIPSPESRLRF